MAYVLIATNDDNRAPADRLCTDLLGADVDVRARSVEFIPGTLEWRYAIEADIRDAALMAFVYATEPDRLNTFEQATRFAAQNGVAMVPVLACDDGEYTAAVECIMRTLSGVDTPHSSVEMLTVRRPVWNTLNTLTTAGGVLALLLVLVVLTLVGAFGGRMREGLAAALANAARYAPLAAPRYQQGRVLFEDDFESVNLDNWTTDGDWRVVLDSATGNYVLEGEGQQQTEITAGDAAWTNYSFEAKARVIRFEDPPFGTGFGLIAHYTLPDDCESAFYVWRPSLDYAVLARADTGLDQPCGSFEQLGLVPFTLSDQWMAVRVDVYGTAVFAFIDDQLLASAVVSNSIPRGQIGFQVPEGNTVWFDNVRVTQLDLVR